MKIDLSKLDLSPENVARTIPMNKKPLREFTPKYQNIELIESYENGTGFMFHYGIYRFKDLVKIMGHRKILSIHDYDDTRTTSINLEREQH